jgi:hypothetical protein
LPVNHTMTMRRSSLFARREVNFGWPASAFFWRMWNCDAVPCTSSLPPDDLTRVYAIPLKKATGRPVAKSQSSELKKGASP